MSIALGPGGVASTISSGPYPTIAASFGTRPTAGDAIVVLISYQRQSGTGTITGIVDNSTGSAAYTNVTTQKDNTGNASEVQIWICPSCGSGSGTFTVTASCSDTGANTGNMGLIDVQGLAGTSDQIKGSNDGGATGTGVTVTANGANATANALVVSMLMLSNYGSSALSNPPTTGYTQIYNDSGGGNFSNAAYKIVTSIETSAATWSWTGASDWAAALVTFDQAAGGGISLAWIT